MANVKKTKKQPTKKQAGGLTYTKLRQYNIAAAVLLFAQGVLILILSSPTKGVVPITANFITMDKTASSTAGYQVMSAANQHLFNLNLAYLVAVFFFISALAHLILATWKRKVYEADLAKGINRARWVEYTLSASLMVVGIALLTGVYDIASLAMIFVLISLMSLLGLNMELRNQEQKKVDWASYSLGVMTGSTSWLVILFYIWSAHVYGSGVPGFVYFIYGTLLLLFVGFAVNMYFQYKKLGHWSTYLYGERVYLILSVVAKSALAWQVFAGTLK